MSVLFVSIVSVMSVIMVFVIWMSVVLVSVQSGVCQYDVCDAC